MASERYVHLLDGQAIHEFMAEVFPGANGLGRIAQVGEGRLVLILDLGDPPDRFLRPGGTISGPTLMTLADTAMYYLVLSLIGLEALAVTSDLTMRFLRRPPAKPVVAEARMLKLGRRLAVGDVHLRSQGVTEPVAHATVTYALP